MLPRLRAFLLGSMGLGAGCGSNPGDLTAPVPANPESQPPVAPAPPQQPRDAPVHGQRVVRPHVPVTTRVGVRAKQHGFDHVNIVDVKTVQGDGFACNAASACDEREVCEYGVCVGTAGASCRTSLDCAANHLCVVADLQSAGTCVATDACACGKGLPKPPPSNGLTPVPSDPDGIDHRPPPLAYVDTVCALHRAETFSGPAQPRAPGEIPHPTGKPTSIQEEALTCLPADGKPFHYDWTIGGNRCNVGDPLHVSGEVRNGRWTLRRVVEMRLEPQHNCGRPLLVDGVAHVADAGDAAWGGTTGGSTADEACDSNWAARMRAVAFAEHASIAAFARTTAQLCALGAPASLIAATSRALSDEVDHAEGAFSLARAFGDETASPGAFPEAVAPMPAFAVLAEALLVDVIRGGCVGETLAVLEAAELRDAAPAQARDYFARVVGDEARHAALAFQTVRWIVAQNQELAHVARRAFDEAIDASGADHACRAMLGDVARATLASLVEGQLVSEDSVQRS